MLKRTLLAVTLAIAGFSQSALADGEYLNHPEYQVLASELETKGLYSRAELDSIYANVNRRNSVLEAISRPAEKRKEWHEYRPNFLSGSRIRKGVAFWKENEATLNQAYKSFGVEPEYIVAILGVETIYGGNKGRSNVLDSLSTLAFEYSPRAAFFRKELVEFLTLAKKEGMDPNQVSGSYAGAMGFPQFMPSSWRNFAVDFSGDGRIDLINSEADAIGSIANYFKAHGWKTNAPVTERARISGDDYEQAVTTDLKIESSVGAIRKLGLIPENGPYHKDWPATAVKLLGEDEPEYWLIFENFYVISRYNRSTMYSMAVHQLAQAIKAERMAAQ